MATANEIVEIIASATGVKPSTVNSYKRNLIAHNIIEKSPGHDVRHLTMREVAALLLAVLIAPNGELAAKAVAEYDALDDALWSVSPAEIRGPRISPIDAITWLLNDLAKPDNANRGDSIKAQVEVVRNWREIRVNLTDGKLLFIPDGVNPNTWQAKAIRTASTLPGVVISIIVTAISKQN